MQLPAATVAMLACRPGTVASPRTVASMQPVVACVLSRAETLIQQCCRLCSAVTYLSGFHRFDPFGPIIKCPRSRPTASYDRWRFCDLTKLPAPCVVYSVGPVQNDYAFEKAILAGTSCEVHTFDCTRDGQSVDARRHRFHRWCLGGNGTDHKSLQQIVSDLNHTRGIDAMKIGKTLPRWSWFMQVILLS
eukprot:GHUV01034013.1.p1 GENE.GHUV01034013.1~~GHUV01034013.1.p1  ORF type:complete len:190 (-),score=16.53 GHUV01034013.1:64-633(-)